MLFGFSSLPFFLHPPKVQESEITEQARPRPVTGLRADLRTWAVVDKALLRGCEEGWTGPSGLEATGLEFILCTMALQ